MRKAFLVMSILLLALSSSLVGSTDETTRWYAQMYLLQPRDATAAGVDIYVYDNDLSSNPDSFVAFRIAIVRVDIMWQIMEWLEVGYFQDASGFYIYSARLIFDGKGYVETYWAKLNGEGANGEGYLDFSIAQSTQNDPNTFRAYMFDPMMGVWSQMEATFTVGGDNLYMAGSESNDPFNTLKGHYDGLWYSKNGNYYDWTDVESQSDPPYFVTMSSTDEFWTSGGTYIPPRNSTSCGGGGGKHVRK